MIFDRIIVTDTLTPTSMLHWICVIERDEPLYCLSCDERVPGLLRDLARHLKAANALPDDYNGVLAVASAVAGQTAPELSCVVAWSLLRGMQGIDDSTPIDPAEKLQVEGEWAAVKSEWLGFVFNSFKPLTSDYDRALIAVSAEEPKRHPDYCDSLAKAIASALAFCRGSFAFLKTQLPVVVQQVEAKRSAAESCDLLPSR